MTKRTESILEHVRRLSEPVNTTCRHCGRPITVLRSYLSIFVFCDRADCVKSRLANKQWDTKETDRA